MQSLNKNIVDSYISERLHRGGLVVRCKNIEPSSNFVERTLDHIQKTEHKLTITSNLYIIGFSILPLISQETWLIIRNDFISVIQLPYGHILLETYKYLITPACSIALGVLPISAIAYLLTKPRLLPAWQRLKFYFNIALN